MIGKHPLPTCSQQPNYGIEEGKCRPIKIEETQIKEYTNRPSN